MVVGLTGEGVVFQEMHPLRLRDQAVDEYDGCGWELRSIAIGSGYHAYYLGVPDTLFAVRPEGKAKIKALSLEVVGSSTLGRDGAFNGGADLHLEVEVPVPAPVALIQLLERFYPDLWHGLDRDDLELFRDPTDESWVLWLPSRSHPLRTPPPAQSPHFHPRMHLGAAIEGLRHPGGKGYWTIRAGCFRESHGRLGHWFGQRFGPAGWAFRRTATAVAANLGAGNEASGWLFWLQPWHLDAATVPEWMGPPAVRHSALHQALSRGFPSRNQGRAGPDEVLSALQALEGLAQLWLNYQDAILAWRSRPAASEWLTGTGESPSTPSAAGDDFISVAAAFIHQYGVGLRVLEKLQEEEWESAALRHPIDRLLRQSAHKAVGPSREKA